VNAISRQIWVLPQLLVVSIALFSFAHLVLFRFHLPNRYTATSLRFILAFAAAIAWLCLLETLLRNWRRTLSIAKASNFPKVVSFKRVLTRVGSVAILLAIAGLIILSPHWQRKFPVTAYTQGESPRLYRFLRQSPKTTLIASLDPAANNIPAFGQRSILVGREYAIPYHLGYYRLFRQRVLDVIQAQYSLDANVLSQINQKYQLTYWLVDPKAFTPEFLNKSWIHQYPEAVTAAQTNLQRGVPILKQRLVDCTVFQEQELHLVDTRCLQRQ
jgi:hypothetical protein